MARKKKKTRRECQQFFTSVHLLIGRPAVQMNLHSFSAVWTVTAWQNDRRDIASQRLWSTGHGNDGHVAGVVTAVKGEAVPHGA